MSDEADAGERQTIGSMTDCPMSPGGPQILREVGGLVIAEDGPRVLVDRGNGPPAILAFVAGVVGPGVHGFGAVNLAAVG